MPADKLDWNPLELGRSVLDQLRECADAPRLYRAILEARAVPDLGPTFFDEAQKRRQAWGDLDACARACEANSDALYAAIAAYPDADLDRTVTLPARKLTLSMAELMLSHHNHLNYHRGQVSYVQTLYGVFEPH